MLEKNFRNFLKKPSNKLKKLQPDRKIERILGQQKKEV